MDTDWHHSLSLAGVISSYISATGGPPSCPPPAPLPPSYPYHPHPHSCSLQHTQSLSLWSLSPLSGDMALSLAFLYLLCLYFCCPET